MSLLQKVKQKMKKANSDPWLMDLSLTAHLDYVRQIAQTSGTPHIIVHFETLNEPPQRINLVREVDDDGQLSAQMKSVPAQIIDNRLYGIASYAKILINAAFSRLIHDSDYSRYRVSWDQSACDLFNDLRRMRGRSLMKRLWGNPTLRQLLSHVNGFAPMNRYLFAPDGTCIMTEEEFLLDGPLIAEEKYQPLYPNRGWQEYSNGNHIFAALILQEVMGKDIHNAMKDLLLDPLDMSNTFFKKPGLAVSQIDLAKHPGFRVSPTTGNCAEVPARYLDDAVESASLGARSDLEDMAVFNRELLRGMNNESSGAFCSEAISNIFKPEYKFTHGGLITLAGLFADTDSIIPGEESSNNDYRRATGVVSYRLGRRSDGSLCTFCYKAGTTDGFSTSVYLLPNDRTFLIVVCNSSGPLDPTDHVARYILQQAFGLRRKVDILGHVHEELTRAQAYIQAFMAELNDHHLQDFSKDDLKHLAGVYKHIKYSQELYIDESGMASIKGGTKSSSAFRIVLVKPNELELRPTEDQLVNETWLSWRDRRFRVQFNGQGRSILTGNAGKDTYNKVQDG